MAVFGVCVCCVVLVASTSLPLSLSSEGTVVGGGERVGSPATLTAQERDELVEQLSKLQISGE